MHQTDTPSGGINSGGQLHQVVSFALIIMSPPPLFPRICSCDCFRRVAIFSMWHDDKHMVTLHAKGEYECGSGSWMYVKNKKFCQSLKIMLNFNENQVTINIVIPITLIFILFMPNYLSFSCVFSSF
jgi:hypothetical protein